MAQTPNFDLRDSPFQNFIINGNMDIAQRGTSFVGVSAGGTYTLDRWRYTVSGGTPAVYTISQDTDVPTLAQSGIISQSSLRLNLTTPDTAIAAGDLIVEEQYVEGFNWSLLAQKPLTLSFWVKATLPGIYCVAFRNNSVDRCYVAEYTINATNTWEKKTITVSASPSAGGWNYTNGIGLRVGFVIAAGTTFQGTANTWNSSNVLATSNQVNGANTGATDFKIAQVMLNSGNDASPFSRAGGTIAGELALCLRYCEVYSGSAEAEGIPQGVCQADSANRAEIVLQYSRKRASPTITLDTLANIRVLTLTAGVSQTPSTMNAFVGTGLYGSNLFFSVPTLATFAITQVTFTGGPAKFVIDAEL